MGYVDRLWFLRLRLAVDIRLGYYVSCQRLIHSGILLKGMKILRAKYICLYLLNY